MVSPGPTPLPGWRESAQVPATLPPQSSPQSSLARGSKISTKDGRQAYNQDYPPEFLRFWNLYPRHRDKRKALKAWRNAIRRGSPDVINAGAKRYATDPNRLDEFTKYAEGWLNGDGWEDEPLPVRLNGKRPEPAFVEEGMSPRTEHVYAENVTCPECGVVHGAL